MSGKRHQWSNVSIGKAVAFVKKEGGGLREASRPFNVPVETLRRRVLGVVEEGSKPGRNRVQPLF